MKARQTGRSESEEDPFYGLKTEGGRNTTACPELEPRTGKDPRGGKRRRPGEWPQGAPHGVLSPGAVLPPAWAIVMGVKGEVPGNSLATLGKSLPDPVPGLS